MGGEPVEVGVAPGIESDFLDVPPSPAVVVLEDEHARAVSVATTADARRFVRSRLGPTDDEPSRRADLRPIVRKIIAHPVGSSFEADLTYLSIARERAPHTYRAVADRWQAWFLHIDPDAPTPFWRKTRLAELVGSGPSGALVGPFPDKDAGGRFGELLDELFELCRYPKELARAPCGRACAYKEMGKCPAACDGSEPMSAYRARMHEAVAFGGGSRGAWIEQRESEMRACAAEEDFERAARIKDRVESAGAALKPKYRHVGAIEDFRVIGVFPSARKKHATVFDCDASGVRTLGDVGGETDLVRVEGEIDAGRAVGFGCTSEQAETVGLVCKHLFHPGKAAGGFVRADDPDRSNSLRKLIRKALKADQLEIGEQELSGDGEGTG